jgi:chemotaxis signal transduction protein
LERTALTGSTRMLVGRTTNEEMTVGLLVDRAQGLRNLRLSDIEKPTGDIESQIAPYLSGAYDSDDEMLVLLDLDRVLNSPRLRQFEPQRV